MRLDFFSFGVPAQSFAEEIWYGTAVIFLIAHTIYAVNKIIWCSLRENGQFSTIYGSIRRFFETYVRCFCIGYIPLVFLTSFLPEDVHYPWFLQDFSWFEMIVFVFTLYPILFSAFLIVLIFLQRCIITCYRALKIKPIVKPKKNARFWQTEQMSTTLTLYTVFRYFASVMWECCYWLALVVLLVTLGDIVVFVLYVFLQPTMTLTDILHEMLKSTCFFGSGLMLATTYYLAFSVIAQHLFGVLWWYLRLHVPKKT